MFLVEIAVGGIVGIAIAALVAGLLIGFFLTRWFIKKELKKNPPISEAQIRAMLSQMGRSPSEKQVRAIMRSMNDAK